MSLLSWACGEEIEFPRKGSDVQSNTDNKRRTTYVRACLLMSSAAALSVRAETMPLASPVTTVWASFQWWQSGARGDDNALVGLANSAVSDGGLFIGYEGSTNGDRLALFKEKNDLTVTKLAAETGISFTRSSLHRVDMVVTTFNNASTNVKVYLEGNSSPVINWTGSTTGLGFTTLDCVRCIGDGSTSQAISEIILADEDTRHFVGVASLAPDGAGDTNTWDSGAYTDIDETVLDDADMLKSGTAAQDFNCTLSNLPAGGFDIAGVKIAVRAVKGASGPSKLGLGVKTGGTENTVDNALTTALASYERLMTTNPVTTNAWTITEVNALQGVFKSVT